MIAERVRHIKPFIVMEVLEAAEQMEKSGIDVVHLEVGEPDFSIPECVKNAVIHAVSNDYTRYTHSMGLPELREAIAAHHAAPGVTVDPDRILVTAGTSPAMLLIFGVLLNPGDEVIISDPHYPCYPSFIEFLDGVPIRVPVYEQDGFQYSVEAIQAKMTPKTRAILINSPANPTGTVLSGERMQQIAGLTPHIISDEIYSGLVYEGAAHSALEFREDAFVINGFSKLYAMTGLRLGYVIAAPDFVRPMQKLQQNFFISANAIIQHAGIAALKQADAYVAEMKTVYNRRRLYMIERLTAMGFGIATLPTAAFYVFANARHLSNDSYRLAFDILRHAHVGVTPGIDFGKNGEGFLRFSYANSMENIEKGLDRIAAYLKKT